MIAPLLFLYGQPLCPQGNRYILNLREDICYFVAVKLKAGSQFEKCFRAKMFKGATHRDNEKHLGTYKMVELSCYMIQIESTLMIRPHCNRVALVDY